MGVDKGTIPSLWNLWSWMNTRRIHWHAQGMEHDKERHQKDGEGTGLAVGAKANRVPCYSPTACNAKWKALTSPNLPKLRVWSILDIVYDLGPVRHCTSLDVMHGTS